MVPITESPAPAQNLGHIRVTRNSYIPARPNPPSGYTAAGRVFADYFPGGTLNPANWLTYLTSGYLGGALANHGSLPAGCSCDGAPSTGFLAYFSPNQVAVNNGLTLAAVPDVTQSGYTYRSGIICSYGLFSLASGYLQVQAKMPDTSSGQWPAIWLMPSTPGRPNANGEIDIMEGGFLATDTTSPPTGVNLLSANDWSFETGLGSWVGVQHVTLVPTTAQALVGTKSMAMTSTAAAWMTAGTAKNLYAVTPGLSYAFACSVRSASVSHANSWYAEIQWFKSDGVTAISNVQTTGAGGSSSTTAWNAVGVVGTAPSNAAYAQVAISVDALAGGEVQYIDNAIFSLTPPPNNVIATTFHNTTVHDLEYMFGTNSDMSADYHIYGVEFIPNTSVKTYFDGQLMGAWTVDVNAGPYCLIIENQIAGATESSFHTIGTPGQPDVLSVSAVEVYTA